jgi:hypothetical protein
MNVASWPLWVCEECLPLCQNSPGFPSAGSEVQSSRPARIETRVYTERLKPFSLKIHLEPVNDASYREDASLLAAPHIGRSRTFFVSGNPAQFLPLLIGKYPRLNRAPFPPAER